MIRQKPTADRRSRGMRIHFDLIACAGEPPKAQPGWLDQTRRQREKAVRRRRRHELCRDPLLYVEILHASESIDQSEREHFESARSDRLKVIEWLRRYVRVWSN